MIILEYKGYEKSSNKISFYYMLGNKNLKQELTTTQGNAIFEETPPYFINLFAIAFAVYLVDLEFFDAINYNYPILESTKIFFEDAIEKGLREYKYKNKIQLDKKIIIQSNQTIRTPIYQMKNDLMNRATVLNGGGKDTFVALEVLKKIGVDFSWLTLNDKPFRRKQRKASGKPETNLYIWKKQAVSYKGHKPLNLFLAMLSLLDHFKSKNKYIVSANENSANEATKIIDNIEINHQYSKSLEFEQKFNQFIKNENLDIAYFSILRPLKESQILKIFSKMTKYHGNFLSCNSGQVNGEWCKKCAKCAFIFIGMRAFVSKAQVVRIFGEDLLEKEAIRDHILDLINADTKPFECIGTVQENLYLVKTLYDNGVLKEIDDEKFIQKIEDEIKNYEELISFDTIEENHNCVPNEIKPVVIECIKTMLKKSNIK